MKTFTEELRYDYPLDHHSLVLDVGAYHGHWSKAISQKYHCDIDAFEPVPKHFAIASQTLAGIPRIHLSQCAISDGKSDTLEIGVSNDSSGIFSRAPERITTKQHSLLHVLSHHGLRPVDLLKLNCEGGEYALLFQAIADGLIPRLKNIQVQFHCVFPDAPAQRDAIRGELSKTHRLTYDAPFVWENWEIL